MAMMLLDALGLVTKTIRLEQDGGYPAGTEIDLGFEMWTVVRTRFFTLDEMRTVDNSLPAKLWRTSRLRAGLARANWRLEDEISSRLFKRRLTEYHAHTLRVGEYALHVAEECPPDLKKAAHNRFDTSFMGCIF